jgi:hypothetical protein
MGYRWQENADNPDLAYDLQVFKPGNAMLVKVQVPRYQNQPQQFLQRPAGRRSSQSPGTPVLGLDAPRDLAFAPGTSRPGAGSGSLTLPSPGLNGGSRTGTHKPACPSGYLFLIAPLLCRSGFLFPTGFLNPEPDDPLHEIVRDRSVQRELNGALAQAVK